MNDQITINKQTIEQEQIKFNVLIKRINEIERKLSNLVEHQKIMYEQLKELENNVH